MINRELFNLLASTLSAVTALMGISVMYGWATNNRAITQIVETFAPMQFNTAVCFVLAGLAVFGIMRVRTFATLSLSLSLIAIAGITGLQYVFNFSLGIDTLLIEPDVTVKTSHPGRMAPNTAICFVLTGLAVLLTTREITHKRRQILVLTLGTVLFALAFTALIGYGSGLDTAYGWGALTRMAVHTALGFTFLSIALLLIAISHSGIRYFHEIPLLPYFSGFSMLLLTLLMWAALLSNTAKHIQALTDRYDEDLSADLTTYFDLKSRAIKRMALRMESIQVNERHLWEQDAKNYMSDYPDLVAISWVSTDGESLWTHIDPQQVDKSDLKLLRPAMPGSAIAGKGELIFSPAHGNSTHYLSAIIATHLGDSRSGYISTFSRPEITFTALKLNRSQEDFFSQLYMGDELIFSDEGAYDQRWRSTASLHALGLPLEIVVYARPRLVAAQRSYLPTAFASIGIILSLFVGMALHYYQVSQRVSLQLGEANQRLNDSLDEVEHAKKQVEAKSSALEQSNRDLENFASVASHDLNEPLRKITIFGERLQSHSGENLDDKGRNYLDVMINGAGRMQGLLDSLLAYSRVNSKGQAFAETDLNAVLTDVQSDLEELIKDNNAEIIANELPTLKADEAQMRQLFQNLIANSIRYHKADVSPVIKIELESNTQASSGARIVVTDNGIGFDNEQAEQIFEVFKRLHSRAEYPGTGMGLAVCKRIMERHGGHIRAEGVPDVGATFILDFPA